MDETEMKGKYLPKQTHAYFEQTPQALKR